jgi:hypothetical protein
VAILSQLARGDLFASREVAESFGRVVIYYLLLVSLIDSTAKLRRFLTWILGAITFMAALAVLQYHGLVVLPGVTIYQQRVEDTESGTTYVTPRLCGSGIFSDPNDLCLALTMGTVLGLYWLSDRRVGMLRFVCVPSLLLLGYTLRLTQSRGGLLGMFVALFALSWVRFGWRKTIVPALVLLPGTLLFLGGRQSEISIEGGNTGQARIQLWNEGLNLFRQSPLFGVGAGRYSDEVGQVAHNSFVHAFTELGFLGGALFSGAFYLALWPLKSRNRVRFDNTDDELQRLQPFLLALVVGYMGGVWSLSRNYVEITFLELGVAQVYLGMVVSTASIPEWNEGLLTRLLVVGAIAMVVLHLVVRATVSYG